MSVRCYAASLCFLCCLLTGPAAAQTTVVGKITDARSGAPLPFATVTAGRAGRYTNDDGTYRLTTKTAPDSVTVSLLGYASRRVAVENGRADCGLQPVAYRTPEVTLSGRRKMKKTEFGHPKFSFSAFSGWWGTTVVRHVGRDFTGNGLLSAVTLRLDVEGNACEVFARVRVVGATPAGPGEDLLRETVVLRLRGGRNRYEVDLREYELPFPAGGVFVGVEFMRPDESCAGVSTNRSRFYAMTNGKEEAALTWQRTGFGRGAWKPFSLPSTGWYNNANFGATVRY